MNIRTMRKLERLGYDKDWLTVVKSEWSPKKSGAYEMVITDNDIFLERTFFNNDYDLSVILQFFEGNICVVTDVASGDKITGGYIDDHLFDDMETWTYEDWDKFSEEELQREKKQVTDMKESLINRLMRENNELLVENVKLRLKLKEIAK